MLFLCIVVLIIGSVCVLAMSGSTISQQLRKRNQEWVSFITAYDRVATKPDQKALINKMLQDISVQGLGNLTKPATGLPGNAKSQPAFITGA